MNACILTVLYEPVDFIMTRNREAGECNISCRHRIARITNILHSLYPQLIGVGKSNPEMQLLIFQSTAQTYIYLQAIYESLE